MGVSENSGTPKSSILIGFSTINHPFWGTPIFGNTQINMPMNNWITFSPVPPRKFSKEGFFFKKSYISPQKKSWKFFCWRKNPHIIDISVQKKKDLQVARVERCCQPQPFLDFMPQGGREVGLHLYGKPRGWRWPMVSRWSFQCPPRFEKLGVKIPWQKNSFPKEASWWFQTFFMFIPIWGRFPIWLIFFKWVETTN